MNIQISNRLYPRLTEANTIEDVLCLATLIASGELHPNATIEDSTAFYEKEVNQDCSICPFKLVCLACIINE